MLTFDGCAFGNMRLRGLTGELLFGHRHPAGLGGLGGERTLSKRDADLVLTARA